MSRVGQKQDSYTEWVDSVELSWYGSTSHMTQIDIELLCIA